MDWRRMPLLALPFWASGLFGQSPDTATGVDRLVREALARNRDILAAQQRVGEARGLLRQAGVRPAPSLEGAAESGKPLRTPGEQEYSVAYSQPLETGGKRSKRLLVAERGVALAEAELAESRQKLAYAIKLQFIEAAAG